MGICSRVNGGLVSGLTKPEEINPVERGFGESMKRICKAENSESDFVGRYAVVFRSMNNNCARQGGGAMRCTAVPVSLHERMQLFVTTVEPIPQTTTMTGKPTDESESAMQSVRERKRCWLRVGIHGSQRSRGVLRSRTFT